MYKYYKRCVYRLAMLVLYEVVVWFVCLFACNNQRTTPSLETPWCLVLQMQSPSQWQAENHLLDLPGSTEYSQFDKSDPIIGSNHGELSCIFALITGDNMDFNLRADHGLRELV